MDREGLDPEEVLARWDAAGDVVRVVVWDRPVSSRHAGNEMAIVMEDLPLMVQTAWPLLKSGALEGKNTG